MRNSFHTLLTSTYCYYYETITTLTPVDYYQWIEDPRINSAGIHFFHLS